MKYPIYVYRDSKRNTFSQPFCDDNDPCAIREFERRCHEVGTTFGYAPSDFDLYCVGEFDTDSGNINSRLPEFIVNGASVVV